jgi:LmbE family N-acetylglucosaminyl deacetylase
MKVLVVAAHPDDEVLGCGGTMARLAGEGHEVFLSIVAEGMTSRAANREDADRLQLDTLHAQARQAAQLLRVKDTFLEGLPDNRLDTVPLLDVVKTIESLITRISPDRIYTHHPGDLNFDHNVVSRAVLTAARPMSGCTVKELYQFEVPSSTEWAFQQYEDNGFRPNTFVDISQTLEVKVKALACYESEVRPFPHPRSSEALRAIAQRWGTVAGCRAAEAFQLVRAIV